MSVSDALMEAVTVFHMAPWLGFECIDASPEDLDALGRSGFTGPPPGPPRHRVPTA